MRETLEKLKKLTPELANLVFVHGPEIDYDVEDGSCSGKGLYSTDKVAIQLATCSKGVYFPEHYHKYVEWLIVVTGKIKVNFKDTFKVASIAEGIYIFPKTIHSVLALEESCVIGITIPADTKGYPSAKI